MSRPVPKSRRRKSLNVSEEEFFERALFLLGPPTNEYEKYADHYTLGYRNWMKRAVNGQKFLALVDGHGEARTRAVSLFLKYKRWYAQQRRTP